MVYQRFVSSAPYQQEVSRRHQSALAEFVGVQLLPAGITPVSVMGVVAQPVRTSMQGCYVAMR